MTDGIKGLAGRASRDGDMVSVLERSGLIKAPPASLIAELLAVILQTVTEGRTSLDIARDMLSRYGAWSVS